jgi:hypothetical protein
MMISVPRNLSDADLLAAVMVLVTCEREAMAALIAHLMEFDARRLYLGAGCRSMFVYCTEVLRLSGHEAYHRIEAARLARRFPIVLEMLADGALNLTTACLLGPHLTDDNHEALVAAAAGKSKREVEVLLAKRFPVPDVPNSIRRVSVPRPHSSLLTGIQDASTGDSPVASSDTSGTVAVASVAVSVADPVVASAVERAAAPTGLPSAQPPGPAKRREIIRPLATDRYEMRFTVTGATRDKLQLATDLLRHSVPDGDLAEIIDRALTLLLKDLARKKFAATPRPKRAREAAPGTRHVPAHVKRAVWLRDGAQCAFVSGGARRCRERGFLEFHHVRPYAVGGETSVDNIELRCRSHNAHEAEQYFGRRFVPPTRRESDVQLFTAPTKPEAGVQLGPDRVDVHLATLRSRLDRP